MDRAQHEPQTGRRFHNYCAVGTVRQAAGGARNSVSSDGHSVVEGASVLLPGILFVSVRGVGGLCGVYVHRAFENAGAVHDDRLVS